MSDVTLPNGRVLRFEVRFGANAGSPKTATTWPTGSPTGIAQVNIDDNNTRMVKDLSTPEGVPPAIKTPASEPEPEPSSPNPVHAPVVVAVAQAKMSFVHVAVSSQVIRRWLCFTPV